MESSGRDLSIDMVVNRFIFKNNQITLSPVSPPYSKQAWDYLKQGLVFTVVQYGISISFLLRKNVSLTERPYGTVQQSVSKV